MLHPRSRFRQRATWFAQAAVPCQVGHWPLPRPMGAWEAHVASDKLMQLGDYPMSWNPEIQQSGTIRDQVCVVYVVLSA
jgi:hypothetical protein